MTTNNASNSFHQAIVRRRQSEAVAVMRPPLHHALKRPPGDLPPSQTPLWPFLAIIALAIYAAAVAEATGAQWPLYVLVTLPVLALAYDHWVRNRQSAAIGRAARRPQRIIADVRPVLMSRVLIVPETRTPRIVGVVTPAIRSGKIVSPVAYRLRAKRTAEPIAGRTSSKRGTNGDTPITIAAARRSDRITNHASAANGAAFANGTAANGASVPTARGGYWRIVRKEPQDDD